MLADKTNPKLAIAGQNNQNFDEIQRVEGCFPFQIGLQQRFPGKALNRVFSSPVGSIYAFYNVYGRPYTLFAYNGSIEIEETPLPVWRIPALAPTSDAWFDDFSGYILGSIARLWGAGIWSGGVGICETIIEGIIDPFSVYDTITSESPIPENVPHTISDSAGAPTGQDTGTNYQFPFNHPQIVLAVRTAISDNSCTGQGTQSVIIVDSVKLYNTPGDFTGTTLHAGDLAIGQQIQWNGIRIGRIPNIVTPGFVIGTCPGPPFPTAIVYYHNINDNSFGVES